MKECKKTCKLPVERANGIRSPTPYQQHGNVAQIWGLRYEEELTASRQLFRNKTISKAHLGALVVDARFYIHGLPHYVTAKPETYYEVHTQFPVALHIVSVQLGHKRGTRN